MPTFEEALRELINQTSQENISNTPDFILAQYMLDCLEAFNKATQERTKWYGGSPCLKTEIITPLTPNNSELEVKGE